MPSERKRTRTRGESDATYAAYGEAADDADYVLEEEEEEEEEWTERSAQRTTHTAKRRRTGDKTGPKTIGSAQGMYFPERVNLALELNRAQHAHERWIDWLTCEQDEQGRVCTFVLRNICFLASFLKIKASSLRVELRKHGFRPFKVDPSQAGHMYGSMGALEACVEGFQHPAFVMDDLESIRTIRRKVTSRRKPAAKKRGSSESSSMSSAAAASRQQQQQHGSAGMVVENTHTPTNNNTTTTTTNAALGAHAHGNASSSCSTCSAMRDDIMKMLHGIVQVQQKQQKQLELMEAKMNGCSKQSFSNLFGTPMPFNQQGQGRTVRSVSPTPQEQAQVDSVAKLEPLVLDRALHNEIFALPDCADARTPSPTPMSDVVLGAATVGSLSSFDSMSSIDFDAFVNGARSVEPLPSMVNDASNDSWSMAMLTE